MENASKALIIAGAILISIVLITIGVVLLQQGDSMTPTGETALNAREIESFNSQFTKYEGSQSGTNVRALITATKSSNAAQSNNGSGHSVKVTKVDGTTEVKSNDVKPAQRYTVEAVYGTDGYVNIMKVNGI